MRWKFKLIETLILKLTHAGCFCNSLIDRELSGVGSCKMHDPTPEIPEIHLE